MLYPSLSSLLISASQKPVRIEFCEWREQHKCLVQEVLTSTILSV